MYGAKFVPPNSAFNRTVHRRGFALGLAGRLTCAC